LRSFKKIEEAFVSEEVKKFFKTDKPMDILSKHKNGKAGYSRKIWAVYTFLVWHKEYFG